MELLAILSHRALLWAPVHQSRLICSCLSLPLWVLTEEQVAVPGGHQVPFGLRPLAPALPLTALLETPISLKNSD